jgi:uncharacterized membrane protein YeaQ/YmgE (transglycosylase-associated protein family)
MNGTNIHALVEHGLTWIGFGVVSGLLAKAILPGRDPGGTIVTMILGLGGALLGTAIYAYAGGEHIGDLISPLGFAIAIGGSIVLLLTHRLFSGRILNLTDEGEDPIVPSPHVTRRRRAARSRSYNGYN